MDLPTLIDACTDAVAPSTVTAIISVESGGNPYAINVNGTPILRVPKFANRADAAEYIGLLEEANRNFDVGLMQVNNNNFGWLNLTAEQLLDPCTNINAGGEVLSEAYRRARARFSHPQHALRAALSAYNTGNFDAGHGNGYVDKVLHNALHDSHLSAAQAANTFVRLQHSELIMSQDLDTEISPKEEARLIDEQLNEVGAVVAVDPLTADAMGAFTEDALSPEEALEATLETAMEINRGR